MSEDRIYKLQEKVSDLQARVKELAAAQKRCEKLEKLGYDIAGLLNTDSEISFQELLKARDKAMRLLSKAGFTE